MKFNIITTLKKLEQLILHMESSSNMAVIGSARSVDQFVTDEDFYTIDTAIISRSKDFVPLLIRLFKLTTHSKLDKKVREALVALGEYSLDPLIGLLETEHGPRAASVLADIGDPRALGPLVRMANIYPAYTNSAIKLGRKAGNDEAIEFFISILMANKPLGFPESLLKKNENQKRIAATNVVLKALQDITGEKHTSADQWSEWWKRKTGSK